MQTKVYSYIPNSVPKTKSHMLKIIGVNSVDELYESIPSELRYDKKLNLPKPICSEQELKQHAKNILDKNKDCTEFSSFLGSGCYNHYVPSVVKEIAGRAEFLTAYGGETYSDLGKYQAVFEYASMLTELLGMGVVGAPTYDSLAAASTSIRMAARLTDDRSEILIPKNISPQRLQHIKNYCKGMKLVFVEYDIQTGLIDVEDLKKKITKNTAGVYVENPNYFGLIETAGDEISKLMHDNGSIFIVGVNPISLGVLEAPGNYGADIVCGDAQTLGVHMHAGGGLTGFIAVKEDDEFIGELPTLLITIANLEDGSDGFGFAQARAERTSYAVREFAREFTGTATGLWAIHNSVYMALMGPIGMYEIGETIIQKSHYAKQLISNIPNLDIKFSSSHFNEFVVDFSKTNFSVSDINKKLLEYEIFGGKDMGDDFSNLKNCALFCITEMNSIEDIHKLVYALKEVTK